MNVKKLENWYLKHHRKLPFRETNNPYHIWVSEIMLQQTQVDTVIPYFKRFIKTYPTVYDLAKTDLDSLFNLIQGLGYYRRFKHMHQAAQIIVDHHSGVFPDTYQALIALPGIGEYSAGAIMSIAFNQPVSATDGNVIRVISRVFNIDKDMRVEKHKKEIKAINQAYIKDANPSIYTQAMMELGALICKPKQPMCHRCPLKEDCQAYQLDKQERLPTLSKKAKKKLIQYKTFVIVDGEDIYLRRRTELLLGGMYEFPQYEGEIPFEYDVLEIYENIKHVFTHLIWVMMVYKVRLESKPLGEWEKIPLSQINNHPMSIAHKKVLKTVFDL